MRDGDEPKPMLFYVKIDFKERNLLFSTCIPARQMQEAIELAEQRLHDHPDFVDSKRLKPCHAYVQTGNAEYRFSYEEGAWVELKRAASRNIQKLASESDGLEQPNTLSLIAVT